MKRFILIFSSIILCVVLSSCETIEKEEKLEVSATVIDKQYKNAYTTMMPVFNGKTTTLIPQRHPALYLVTISYDDVSETFEDRKLYENVKKGDDIKMILYKGYDKKNNLIIKTIQLTDEE